MVSSARASVDVSPMVRSGEEVDLLLRSNKKVPDQETEPDIPNIGSSMETVDVAIKNVNPERVIIPNQEVNMSEKESILAIESYKDKLLNIFGEEVSQKLQGNSKIENLMSESSNSQLNPTNVKETKDGAGVEIPLSNDGWKTLSLPW